MADLVNVIVGITIFAVAFGIGWIVGVFLDALGVI